MNFCLKKYIEILNTVEHESVDIKNCKYHLCLWVLICEINIWIVALKGLYKQ